ncbi:MAG: hypothetical protein HQ536_02625 [Parcubacteria group bacterium]|nr:hypothetical protein [Parcubacteria group bacterium]
MNKNAKIVLLSAAGVALKVLIQVLLGGRVPDMPFAIAMALMVGITYFPVFGPYTGAASMALIAIAGTVTGFFLKQGLGFLFQDVGIVLGLLTIAEVIRVRRELQGH